MRRQKAPFNERLERHTPRWWLLCSAPLLTVWFWFAQFLFLFLFLFRFRPKTHTHAINGRGMPRTRAAWQFWHYLSVDLCATRFPTSLSLSLAVSLLFSLPFCGNLIFVLTAPNSSAAALTGADTSTELFKSSNFNCTLIGRSAAALMLAPWNCSRHRSATARKQ